MVATNETTARPNARLQILESAIILMKQSGLTGAGINQIVAHSGAPKGSLYYHFPGGKQQIAIEALTLYAERVAHAFERALSSKKTPADKIRALLGFVAERFEEAAFIQSCAGVSPSTTACPSLPANAAQVFTPISSPTSCPAICVLRPMTIL